MASFKRARPKVYVRDTGLLHALAGIRTEHELMGHPMLGASWKDFALEQVLRLAKPDEAYFWATYQGAELDLLMLHRGQRIGVEFKRQPFLSACALQLTT